MTDHPEIPAVIAQMMRPEEIENMRNLQGWAVGTVALYEADVGAITSRTEDAWIELFNGEGVAGAFGGVGFQAVDEENGHKVPHVESDEPYNESYAFATREAFEQSRQETGWLVESWDTPEDPDWGDPAP